MTLSDNYPPLDPNSCMGYGMAHGCDRECPALWEGECSEFGEVAKQILPSIEADEFAELAALYLSPSERMDLLVEILDSLPNEKSEDKSNQTCRSIW